jgi:hypothetical protein
MLELAVAERQPMQVDLMAVRPELRARRAK